MQDARQQEIDFARCEKYAILDRAVLPRLGEVSPHLLKSILRQIYSFSGDDGWCFASQPKIALHCGLKNRRQVGRAIRVLQSLYLIAVEVKKGPSCPKVNYIRIIWGNLALLVAPDNKADGRRNPASTNGDKRSGQWGQFGKPMGTNGSGNGDNHVPRITKNIQDPPPTSKPGAVAVVFDEWKQAEQELQAEGVAIASKLCGEAKASGQGARDVLAVIHDYRANRSRLKGPGAIVTRLRNGVWPAAGVGVASEVEAKQEAASKAREFELIRTEAVRIEKALRRQKKTREERRQELSQRIPAGVLTVLAQADLRFLFE